MQKQLSETTDAAAAEKLQNLITDVNAIWKSMDDFHSFYTKLQSQAVSTSDALNMVKAIAEETPDWDSLSPAEKSKLIIEKAPELAQGRLWIKAFTPDQNIAVNDFLKNNWNAKLYGSSTMHAYFDSQLRLGHDADIALGMGATDEQGAFSRPEVWCSICIKPKSQCAICFVHKGICYWIY